MIAPIADVLADKEKVVFIPDGVLFYAPLEALIQTTEAVTAAPQNVDFSQLPYLIKTYTIAYHYSAALYARTWQQPLAANTSRYQFIGFAAGNLAGERSGKRALAGRQHTSRR